MSKSNSELLAVVQASYMKRDFPDFRVGDAVKVHTRIIEGSKERIQIFEGTVISRSKGKNAAATFTVRKVSYNIGVEKTFLLHSPRVERIEMVSKGKVRRARLYYLRDLRGKAARIKKEGGIMDSQEVPSTAVAQTDAVEAAAGN